MLEVLREVDLVAAEDTRRSRRLLSRYEIHTPLSSYREENREKAGARILKRLLEGSQVALVSDAGTPGISDPGRHLVGLCLENGVEVVPLPGPNAAVCGLVASGLPASRFAFEGFPPRKRGRRRRALESLASEERTLVFYESPQRIVSTLEDVLEVMGDRRVAVARELTKIHEEVIRGNVSEVLARLTEGGVRGEIVLVVAGAPPATEAGLEEEAVGEVLRRIEEGMSLKDAVARTHPEYPGLSRNDLYERALEARR